MKDNLITEPLESVNDVLDSITFRYFAPLTGSASARIERWDTDGPVDIVAAGTRRDCWVFVQGLEMALEVTNRLPRG